MVGPFFWLYTLLGVDDTVGVGGVALITGTSARRRKRHKRKR